MRGIGLPDPVEASDLDGLITRLRLLKSWAGSPSYATIADKVNQAWRTAGRAEAELTRRSTVADCFRLGRSRLDEELLVAIVLALRPDRGYAERWRTALRALREQTAKAAIVNTHVGLPKDPPGFVGRHHELQMVEEAVLQASAGATVVVSAINGMAGVGKTRLALHAAHRLAGRGFGKDVQLFVDLRGFDPGAPPADPVAVLGDFLRHLGVPSDQIPPRLDGRITKYRRLLRDTNAMVVLDNAADTATVTPLLPHSHTCLTLVTSRRALTDLPDTCHVSLDVFTSPESLTLLRRIAGDQRIDMDTNTAARIAELVGHLPLALLIIGGHMRDHPDWLLGDYLEPLTTLAMEGGVRAALALSDRDLPDDCRRTLRLIALHPGQGLNMYAACALTDQPLERAQQHLDTLNAANLVQTQAPSRYSLHDLVRAFARERARVDEPPSRTRQALTRLFDHYRHTAAMAMDMLYPFGKARRPRPAAPASPVPALDTAEDARAWLDAERTNLLAVATHAPTHWPDHTIDLAEILSRHLDTIGDYEAVITLQNHALQASHVRHDRTSEAHALTNLGISFARQGHYDKALGSFQQAVSTYRETSDRVAEGRALSNLGELYTLRARYRQALDCQHQALTIAQETRDRTAEGRTLTNIGMVYRHLGRHEDELSHHQQALEIAHEVEDRVGECLALDNIGGAQRRLDRPAAALHNHRQALTVAREIGFRYGEGLALHGIGSTRLAQGQYTEALEHYQQALALFRETGDHTQQIETLNDVGEALRHLGRHNEALDHHQVALTLAADSGNRLDQARAMTGIGDTHRELGHPDDAHHHWRQALHLYTELGLPEANDIHNRLATNTQRSETAK